MKDSVTLTSGKSFSCKYLNEHPMGLLFIHISGSDMTEIVSYFTNAEETAILQFGGKTYEGYTTFQAVSVQPNGDIRVTMKR